MLSTYAKHSDILFEQLPKGVFLTVKDHKGNVNTMTISWGHIGIVWNLPVFIVYVKTSRYTHELMSNATDFTVNVPKEGTLKQALKIAGEVSGNKTDKFEKGNITLGESRQVKTPIIKECQLQYECSIIYKQSQNPQEMMKDVVNKHYPDDHHHVVFYGKIVDTYLTKEAI